MRRRDLIGSFALLALASQPRRSRAQPARVFRIGTLSPGVPMGEGTPFGTLLLKGLAQKGYFPGKNLKLEVEGVQSHFELIPQALARLVASRVDLIVVQGYQTTLATKQTTIPTVAVFGTGDPVETGLVKSLANPGGNITGISDVSAELSPKRLQFLKELAPNMKRVAMLWNAEDYGMTLRVRESERAANSLGLEVQPIGVREPDDFGDAFSVMERRVPDGILMVSDAMTVLNRKRVIDFASSHRIPSIYEQDFLVRDGGLMSYGPDLKGNFERAADLVDRILKGADPANLPFENPTRFSLVINTKVAQAIGITVPESLLLQADEVIQ
jgi:putative tryptophan/tyrosine transport system substrate-binding protein